MAETGRALAVVNAGSPIGLVVVAVLVLVSGTDWRTAWLGFAAIGLLAAAASWWVLVPGAVGRVFGHPRPQFRGFLNPCSNRMLAVAFGMSIICGANFMFAPASAKNAGFANWIGPAMWVVWEVQAPGLASLQEAFPTAMG
ncbi:MAG: hypothetical protein WD360_00910 [Nitriliruptoraceae bacterium]